MVWLKPDAHITVATAAGGKSPPNKRHWSAAMAVVYAYIMNNEATVRSQGRYIAILN